MHSFSRSDWEVKHISSQLPGTHRPQSSFERSHWRVTTGMSNGVIQISWVIKWYYVLYGMTCCNQKLLYKSSPYPEGASLWLLSSVSSLDHHDLYVVLNTGTLKIFDGRAPSFVYAIGLYAQLGCAFGLDKLQKAHCQCAPCLHYQFWFMGG